MTSQTDKNNNNGGIVPPPDIPPRGLWENCLYSMWHTPLGLFGLATTIISIVLMMISLTIDMLGLVHNAYFAAFSYMILPMFMILGLVVIPLACYIHSRRWFRASLGAELSDKALCIDLSNLRHRKYLLGFVALTVINMSILTIIGYEGYEFSDSPYFCGQLCHKVMAPEYTAYLRSPHARVRCVECHIGPGVSWYVKAKISGLKQVVAVITGDYPRPIPTPLEHLRPARDTCEQCHWPDKFSGKKVLTFYSFTDKDQIHPQKEVIALHIGGRNPYTGKFEGIHWHVSKDVKVEYLALNRQRTKIGTVKVTLPNGVTEVFYSDEVPAKGQKGTWRTMDCLDCHNRPAHNFDRLDDRVDFGLMSKDIDPLIPGIRADSLTVLTKKYASRAQAKKQIVVTLMDLQAKRNGAAFVQKHSAQIVKSGQFLLTSYLRNIWPAMNLTWGTYKSQLGHRDADAGYGCWRCHDDEHKTKFGKVISQNCDLCHDEPS